MAGACPVTTNGLDYGVELPEMYYKNNNRSAGMLVCAVRLAAGATPTFPAAKEQAKNMRTSDRS